MSPLRDPTKTAGELLEAAKRRDSRRDPSDPPPSSSEPPPSKRRAPELGHILADIYAWGQRTSRAVVVLLAVWGTFSTFVSVGGSYLIFHLWDDKRETEIAKMRRESTDNIEAIRKSAERVELTVSGFAPRLAKLEDREDTQGNKQIALESWAKTRGYRP